MRALMNLSDIVGNDNEDNVKSIQFTSIKAAKNQRVKMQIYVTILRRGVV